MDSMQGEMDDSRTSTVGRKRNLEELQDVDTSRHSSPGEDRQRIKRVKEGDPSEDSMVEDGIILSTSSPLLVSAEGPPNEPSILSIPSSNAPSTTVPPLVGAWNKGIQSGVRTSFGNRARTQSKSQPKPATLSSQSNADALVITTPLLQGHASESLNRDEAVDTKAAEFVETSEESVSHIDEAGDVTMAEADIPEIQTAVTSEEEGEITSEASEQIAGGKGSFSNGRAGDANSLSQRAPRFIEREDRQPVGDDSGVDLKPREIAGLPSSRGSNVYNMEDGCVDDAEEADSSFVSHAAYPNLKTQSHTGQEFQLIDGEQKERLKALSELESFNLLTAEAEAMFAHQGLPLPKKYSTVQANVAAGRTFFPRTTRRDKPFYKKKGINYIISEILDQGRPIRIQDLIIDMFAPVFLEANSGKKVTENILASAFNAYQTTFYSNAVTMILRSNGADKDEVKEATRQQAKAFLARSPPITDAKTPSDAAIGIDESTSEFDNGDVGLYAATEIDIDQADIDQMERDLQAKYFPPTQDLPATYHCLACGENTHMTLECPSLTCNLCGGDHTQLACKQNRRCNKCRQQGHDAARCPEKLVRAKAEAIGCEFCGSTDHFEAHCHTIWRTFHPKPEEIRKVREIAVHCYICGGAGHFGPECGLYRDCPLLTGGQTWSKDNLTKFLDTTSADRAISAGIDYSIVSKAKKSLSIKGKASNPISLDESDDGDVTFLQEKIKGPKNRAQIKIAGAARLGQASQRAYYLRAPNPPRDSRPNFGRDFGWDGRPSFEESARYGRERSFSPPPRFDDMRYALTEPEVRRPRENVYRPLPPQARQDYDPAPQASLPVRPSGNNPRGGRGGCGGKNTHGGSAGGGQNTQSGGAGGGKKKKKKNKQADRGGGGAGRGGSARRGK